MGFTYDYMEWLLSFGNLEADKDKYTLEEVRKEVFEVVNKEDQDVRKKIWIILKYNHKTNVFSDNSMLWKFKKIMEEIFEPPSSEAILKNKKSQELLHKVRDL